MHTNYHQAIAATGRLSSAEPNLQNIPIRTEEGRRIRQAFVAPPGWKVVAADYSQIELRIMAHLSGDAGLLARVPRRSGRAPRHRGGSVRRAARTRSTTNQRRAAKAINFGLMYGMSAFGLARQLGVDRGEAQRLHGPLFLALSRRARVHGRARASRRIATATSKPCSAAGCICDDINSRNQAQRAGAERAAINAPMQGTAADIIKRAMIAVDGWLRRRARRRAC